MPRIDRLWYDLEMHTKQFDEGVLQSQNKLKSFADFAKGHPLAVIGALGAAAVVAGVKIANMGAEFQQQMALVNTAAQVSKEELQGLSDGVLSTFRNLPVGSIEELTKGLYDLVSSGVAAADAIDVLNIASKAAIGGATTTAVAVDALTSVLNAYKSTGLDAAHASDVMFAAVNKGKISYQEFASSVGNVVGIAAAANITLEDLSAAVAQLTLKGISGAQAFDGVRAAITNILNPTERFRELFPELAAEFNEGKLKGEGFTKFLLDLNKAANGNSQVLHTLFSDVNAYKTAVALLNDGGKGLTNSLNEMSNSAGQAEGAFQTMAETSKALKQSLSNELKAELTELGTNVLPIFNAALIGAVTTLKLLNGTLFDAKIKEKLRGIADELRGYGVDGGDGKPLRELLNADQFDQLVEKVHAFSDAVTSGRLDLSEFTHDQLDSLAASIKVISQNYPGLGKYAADAYNRITAAIQEKTAAERKDAAAAAEARDATLKDIGHTAEEARQDAADILKRRDATLAYGSALRQRAAAQKVIEDSLVKLNAAEAAGRAAAAAGDTAGVNAAKQQADAARASIDAQREAVLKADSVIREHNLTVTRAQNGVQDLINQFVAKAIPGQMDEIAASLQHLYNEAERVRAIGGVVNQADLDRVTVLARGLRIVALEAEKTRQVLINTGARAGSAPVTSNYSDLATRELQLGLQINALDRSSSDYAARRRDLEEQIIKIQERRAQLTEHDKEVNRKITDELAKQRESITKALQDQANAIQGIAGGALQLGQAFGVLDAKTSSMLSNVVQIGSSIGPLLDMIQKWKSGQVDSSGNALATLGGVTGAALPLIGAAAGIIGAVVSSQNADRAETRRIQKENTSALRKLSEVIGEFSLNITGNEFTKGKLAATTALGKLTSGDVSFSFTEKAVDLAKRLDASMASLGVSMDDLRKLAGQLGLTLDERSPLTLFNSLKEIVKALQEVQLTQFAQTFTGQLQALQGEFELFNITEPIDQLKKLVDLFNDPNFGAPALREALAGLDLNTPEGREAAKKAVQQLFTLLQSGALDPSQLGGLTPQQLLDQLINIGHLLDQTTGADGGSTRQFSIDRTITEVTGSRMAGLLLTSNVFLEQIAGNTAFLKPGGPIISPPPVLGPSGTSSVAGLTVQQLTVTVSVQGDVSESRAKTIGEATAKGFMDKINEQLGQRTRTRKIIQGTALSAG